MVLTFRWKIKEKYGIDINWILERDDISDHHKIAKHVAQEAETEEEVIRSFAIEKYIGEISTEFDDLIFQIQKYL